MRTAVRSLRPARITAWPAAWGIRWVKPSMATGIAIMDERRHRVRERDDLGHGAVRDAGQTVRVINRCRAARACPSLTGTRQAATAARRGCGALAEAPAAGPAAVSDKRLDRFRAKRKRSRNARARSAPRPWRSSRGSPARRSPTPAASSAWAEKPWWRMSAGMQATSPARMVTTARGSPRMLVLHLPDDLVRELDEPLDPVVTVLHRQDELLGGWGRTGCPSPRSRRTGSRSRPSARGRRRG